MAQAHSSWSLVEFVCLLAVTAISRPCGRRLRILPTWVFSRTLPLLCTMFESDMQKLRSRKKRRRHTRTSFDAHQMFKHLVPPFSMSGACFSTGARPEEVHHRQPLRPIETYLRGRWCFRLFWDLFVGLLALLGAFRISLSPSSEPWRLSWTRQRHAILKSRTRKRHHGFLFARRTTKSKPHCLLPTCFRGINPTARISSRFSP